MYMSQRARSPEELLCICTTCLQEHPEGIRQPIWRKEAHDRADIARASASATRGRGMLSRVKDTTRISAAASRSRGNLAMTQARASRYYSWLVSIHFLVNANIKI